MADEQGAVAVELLANKSRRRRTRPVAFKEGGTAEHKQAKGLFHVLIDTRLGAQRRALTREEVR